MENPSVQTPITPKSPVTQPSVPVQSSTTPPTPTSKKRVNKWLITLIIGIMTLLSVVGVLVYRYYQKNQTGKTHLVASPTTALPSPSPTDGLTDEWETYINDKYQFSFQYPPEWKFEEYPWIDSSISNMLLIKFPHTGYENSDAWSMINVHIISEEEKSFDPLFIIDTNKQDRVTNDKMFKIDFEDARRFELFQGNSPNGGIFKQIVIVNNKGNKFTISYSETINEIYVKEVEKWKYKQVFDQILSSFKFID